MLAHSSCPAGDRWLAHIPRVGLPASTALCQVCEEVRKRQAEGLRVRSRNAVIRISIDSWITSLFSFVSFLDFDRVHWIPIYLNLNFPEG